MRIMGADIGAAEIVACILSEIPKDPKSAYNQFKQKESNFRRITLYKPEEIRILDPDLIICEPTGLYSDPWIKLFEKMKIPYLLMPTNVLRAWQQANGMKNKTDQLDSYCLAAYGQYHHNDPTKWINLNAVFLRRTCQEIESLQKMQNQYINRSRQTLLTECPELYPMTITAEHAAWKVLASIPTKKSLEIEEIIQNTKGIGISQRTRNTAKLICQIEKEIRDLHKQLCLRLREQWSTQRKIMAPYRLGPRLEAHILPLITPLERLKMKPISEHYYTENGKRQKHSPALKAWKMALGLGTIISQSGKQRREYMGGSQACRTLLYLWVVRQVLSNRATNATLSKLKAWHQSLDPKKPGKVRIMRTAAKAMTQLFWELIAELDNKG